MLRDSLFDRSRLNPARVLAIMAAACMPFYGSVARIVPLGKGRRWKPHQGAQEIARRRRQIERGQLTASNGLVG